MRKKVALVSTDDIAWVDGSMAEIVIDNGILSYRVDGVVQVGNEEEHLHSVRVIDCATIKDLHFMSNRITKNASLTINSDLFTLEGTIETVQPVFTKLLGYLTKKEVEV